jgi:Fur family ferric uptake transcriptional regulator
VTSAPRAAPLSFASLEEAEGALRARGLRLSSPRRLVLETLFETDAPASAEQLATAARLDPASVYRNLETLERHGLVRHMHLGHGPGLYVLVGRGEREYVCCEQCGLVRALAPEQLDPVRDRVRELTGFDARFTHFPIVGLCEGCASGRAG